MDREVFSGALEVISQSLPESYKSMVSSFLVLLSLCLSGENPARRANTCVPRVLTALIRTALTEQNGWSSPYALHEGWHTQNTKWYQCLYVVNILFYDHSPPYKHGHRIDFYIHIIGN